MSGTGILGDGFRPDVTIVRPEDFAGRYSFYDDGWTGRLLLEHDGDGRLWGTYHSDRDDRDYRASSSVGPPPHRIELIIHEFNWMDQQVYTGHLFSQGKGAFAGSSVWQGKPFGFFARRATPLPLSAYRAGRAEPQDLLGGYGVRIDGYRLDLMLSQQRGEALIGRCWNDRLGVDLPVEASIGGEVPHQVRIVVGPGRPEALSLDGYLFSEPKNAIAGSLQWEDVRLGFYMIRYE